MYPSLILMILFFSNHSFVFHDLFCPLCVCICLLCFVLNIMMILFDEFNTSWVLKNAFYLPWIASVPSDSFCLLVLEPAFFMGGPTNSSHPSHLLIFTNEASKSWLEALGMGYVLPSRVYCILKLEWFIEGMSKCQLSIVFPTLEYFCFSRDDLCSFLIQCWGNRLHQRGKQTFLFDFLLECPQAQFSKNELCKSNMHLFYIVVWENFQSSLKAKARFRMSVSTILVINYLSGGKGWMIQNSNNKLLVRCILPI